MYKHSAQNTASLMTTDSTARGDYTPLHELTADGLCEFLHECDARLAPVANVLRGHNISGREMMHQTANGLQDMGLSLHSAMAVMWHAFCRLRGYQVWHGGTRRLEHMRAVQAG